MTILNPILSNSKWLTGLRKTKRRWQIWQVIMNKKALGVLKNNVKVVDLSVRGNTDIQAGSLQKLDNLSWSTLLFGHQWKHNISYNSSHNTECYTEWKLWPDRPFNLRIFMSDALRQPKSTFILLYLNDGDGDHLNKRRPCGLTAHILCIIMFCKVTVSCQTVLKANLIFFFYFFFFFLLFPYG